MTYRPTILLTAAALAAMTGCGTEAPDRDAEIVTARRAADMLYAIIEADRATYTRHVVDRLTRQESVSIVDPESGEATPLVASERWKSEHGALPLPSQMFKMAAGEASEGASGLHYALLSEWPISDQNRARTDLETEGLVAVREGDEPFYGTESLAGDDYFTAVYPDVAVTEACVSCHNTHPDSPRDDFALGDVMGGVVVRIALGDDV
jgi:hypothetical protein